MLARIDRPRNLGWTAISARINEAPASVAGDPGFRFRFKPGYSVLATDGGDASMLRVFTDFNARTSDGICWNLVYQGTDLDKQADDLHLAKGDKIILFQDENDF
jgi:hypothetical protein